MNDTQFHVILAELVGIRRALQARASAPQTVKATPKAASVDSLPLPDRVIENAGEVTVHFGKNAGTAISQLSDKQLLWYGADREPLIKRDGTPFEPRESDVLLRDACRTIWHERKGTLPSSAPAPASVDQAPAPVVDEDVPF